MLPLDNARGRGSLQNFPRDLGQLIWRIGARQEHDKLVASNAGNHPPAGNRRHKQLGGTSQNTVTRTMSMGVVHRFEMIQIDVENRKIGRLSSGTLVTDKPGVDLVQLAAIGQPCQRVMPAVMLHRGAGNLQLFGLADVLGDIDIDTDKSRTRPLHRMNIFRATTHMADLSIRADNPVITIKVLLFIKTFIGLGDYIYLVVGVNIGIPLIAGADVQTVAYAINRAHVLVPMNLCPINIILPNSNARGLQRNL